MVNMNAMLLWIVLPYMSIAIFLMGVVWRYDMGHIKGDKQPSNLVERLEKGSTFLVFAVGALVGLGVMFGPETVTFQWLKGLMLLSPNVELMTNAPIFQQILAIIFFIVIGITPFSRYMSFFTYPFSEIIRIARGNPKVTSR